MAAPVFFIDPGSAPDSEGIVCVTGEEARHATQVMRLRAGERVDLVDGEGRRLEGTVRSVSRDQLDVEIARITEEPDPAPRIVVIQALVKGDRGEQAVAAMTEVGVDEIVPWSAEHCITRWTGDRAQRGVSKWRATARASAKQSRRSRVPAVHDVHTLSELDAWTEQAALVLCLDESAEESLAGIDIPDSGDIVLVVGPEGGLSDAERAHLVGLGARLARLGPTVLRTSTAGPVGAAVVLARSPRWGATP
jgi:16S rRNA (uracil1498-N3)-methyltransferase